MTHIKGDHGAEVPELTLAGV